MRKLFIAALITVASFSAGLAQETSAPQTTEIPNMGKAPKEPNGIGRLDLRVFDEAGNPIGNVYVKLESNRTDGFFCESWNWTNAKGVAVLPPIHMGRLTLIAKAKGFATLKIEIPANTLDEPVRITMIRKK